MPRKTKKSGPSLPPVVDEQTAKYNERYFRFMALHPEYKKYKMPAVGQYEEINTKTYLTSQRYEWLKAFWRLYLDWCKEHPI
jgi:hypothetical protein